MRTPPIRTLHPSIHGEVRTLRTHDGPGCERAPHSPEKPAQPNNGVRQVGHDWETATTSPQVPSGPRSRRAAVHTHAAYVVRSGLPHCDPIRATPAHTPALDGRILQKGTSRGWNRGTAAGTAQAMQGAHMPSNPKTGRLRGGGVRVRQSLPTVRHLEPSGRFPHQPHPCARSVNV